MAETPSKQPRSARSAGRPEPRRLKSRRSFATFVPTPRILVSEAPAAPLNQSPPEPEPTAEQPEPTIEQPEQHSDQHVQGQGSQPIDALPKGQQEQPVATVVKRASPKSFGTYRAPVATKIVVSQPPTERASTSKPQPKVGKRLKPKRRVRVKPGLRSSKSVSVKSEHSRPNTRRILWLAATACMFIAAHSVDRLGDVPPSSKVLAPAGDVLWATAVDGDVIIVTKAPIGQTQEATKKARRLWLESGAPRDLLIFNPDGSQAGQMRGNRYEPFDDDTGAADE